MDSGNDHSTISEDVHTENQAASGSGLGLSQVLEDGHDLKKPKPPLPKEKDVFCDPSSSSTFHYVTGGPYMLPSSKINEGSITPHGMSEGPKNGEVYDNIKDHLQPTLERLKELSKLEPTINVATEILVSLSLLEIISRQPLHPVIEEKVRKKTGKGVQLMRQGTDLIIECRKLLRSGITENCQEYSTYVEGIGEIYDDLKGHLQPILERLKEVSELVIITSDVGLEMVESIRLLQIICKSPVQPVIEEVIKKADRGAAKLWRGERKIAGVQHILRSAISEEMDFSLPLPKIWNRLPSLKCLSSTSLYSDSDSD